MEGAGGGGDGGAAPTDFLTPAHEQRSWGDGDIKSINSGSPWLPITALDTLVSPQIPGSQRQRSDRALPAGWTPTPRNGGTLSHTAPHSTL